MVIIHRAGFRDQGISSDQKEKGISGLQDQGISSDQGREGISGLRDQGINSDKGREDISGLRDQGINSDQGREGISGFRDQGTEIQNCRLVSVVACDHVTFLNKLIASSIENQCDGNLYNDWEILSPRELKDNRAEKPKNWDE
ncbi:hypothetical protein AXG93_3823s1000 [Marchantia polymorpha subsp. ruderalis]|uniref:Uncharacterized protein n=1 Tax=Marchantia polymorpha subsp. ruderalis TaxID=1480154 RepID=A0A176WQ35_MARPO|nr:hypothetical protein AXG93_3823s1000 [Marchantia polymorpha subsp. ruderalis]